MNISTISLATVGAFGAENEEEEEEEEEEVLPKDEGTLNNWLNRLANALKRLAEKAVEALSAIVRSVVGAILSLFWQGCLICC